MKRALLFSLAALFLIVLVAAPQALALDIEISSDGTIYFYESNVLGEDTLSESGDSDESSDSETRSLLRTVPRSAQRRLRVSSDGDTTNIRLDGVRRSRSSDLTDIAETTTDRLNIDLPSSFTRRQLRAIGLREDSQGTDEESRNYRDRLREARQDRRTDRIEIRSQIRDGETQFSLRSNLTDARLRGAEFSIDPDTNEVVITTPSGNEHVLSHLPDQAIERMTAAGFFSDSTGGEDGDDPQLAIGTNQDGELVYTARRTRRRRLFGIIGRDVDTEVELDDLTGDVTETVLPGDTPLEEFLNTFSF